MYRKMMFVCTRLTALVACAPLQQAPLVYSSKNVRRRSGHFRHDQRSARGLHQYWLQAS
jgi:hypothetical protein